jgi:hypothetical protein
VNEAEILEELLALAAAAGLRVRSIGGRPGGEGEPAARSGLCRVRGETWVVLSAADPVEERCAVLADALRSLCAPWLEGRYLPPALRRLLSPET